MSASAGSSAREGIRPTNQEAYCKRTAFFVNADWPFGTPLQEAKTVVGQMYVESLEPMVKTQKYPVVLIHGDFHTGQIWLTKPDGHPGWASYFLNRGYHVYTLDLPPCGRSNFLTGEHFRYREISQHSLDASFVERELTAPEKHPPVYEGRPSWPRAPWHDKWPGTGQRGDAIFARYCASLTTLALRKPEREALAQQALCELLKVTGKAVLIGEGSGSTMAWLAADAVPDLVVGVVAVEPAGPPCGVAFASQPTGRLYTSHIQFQENCRRYGLADIPLTFDPPLPRVDSDGDASVLDVDMLPRADDLGCCVIQRPMGANKDEAHVVRQLKHLKKMPHAIVTAQASPHTTYDWATVVFMRQAGVPVDWIKLEDLEIRGNGHLMFLETNSDQVASVIDSCVKKMTTPNRAAGSARVGGTASASSSNMYVPLHDEKAVEASSSRDSIKAEVKQHPSERVASESAPAPSHKRNKSKVLAQQAKGEAENTPRKPASKRQQLGQSAPGTGLHYAARFFPQNGAHNGNSMVPMAMPEQNPYLNQQAPSTNMGGGPYAGIVNTGMMQGFYQPRQWNYDLPLEQFAQGCICLNAAMEANHVCGGQMGDGVGDFADNSSGTQGFESPRIATNNESTGQLAGYYQVGQGMAQSGLYPAQWANGFNMGPTQTVRGYDMAPNELQVQTDQMQVIQGQQNSTAASAMLFQPAYNHVPHNGAHVSTPQQQPQRLYPSPASLGQSGGSDVTLGTMPIVVSSSPTPAPRGNLNQARTQLLSDFVADIKGFIEPSERE